MKKRRFFVLAYLQEMVWSFNFSIPITFPSRNCYEWLSFFSFRLTLDPTTCRFRLISFSFSPRTQRLTYTLNLPLSISRTLPLSVYHSLPIIPLLRLQVWDRPGSPGKGILPKVGVMGPGSGVAGSSPESLLFVTPSKRSEDVQKLGDLVRALPRLCCLPLSSFLAVPCPIATLSQCCYVSLRFYRPALHSMTEHLLDNNITL